MTELKDRFLIGSHHAMERFGVLFIICSIALVCSLVYCFSMQVEKNSVDFSNRSLYTDSFSTSLSGVTGTVTGTYTNDDNTMFAVTMHLDDVSKASRELDNYSLLLSTTNENEDLLPIDPNMGIALYRYGTTGDYVALFNRPDGFSSELYYMLVSDDNRQYEDVKADSEQNPDGLSGAELVEYWESQVDQFGVIFNPGGLDAVVAKSLNADTFNPAEFYAEVIGQQKLDIAFDTLDKSMADINLAYNKIVDDIKRLQDDGVVVSDKLPEYVATDRLQVNEDGTISFSNVSVVPGGYDFDWRTVSLGNTDLSHIALAYTGPVDEENADVATSLSDADAAQARADAERTEAMKALPLDTDWKLSDGRAVEELKTSDTAAYSLCSTDIKAFNSDVQTYMDLKETYQTSHLTDVLDIIYEYNKAVDNIQSREDADLAGLYVGK